MNVIVANRQQEQLAELDIDIIKSITGEYDANEIVGMFNSFFYSKMILDVTALKDYEDFNTFEVLTKGLDPDKIIFLLPEGSRLCTSNFLSHLIDIGIYNFTTNTNGIRYLLKKPNTLKDVEHIKMQVIAEATKETGATVTTVTSRVASRSTIIGVRNVTEHAGATTFIYLLKKELAFAYGQDSVLAIEIEKNDFSMFNDKNMISAREKDIKHVIELNMSKSFILVDLNNCADDKFCGEVIYLLEPSTIKLNKLVKRNKTIFSQLVGKRVVLNQSLLLNNDVFDFESEAAIKVFYNMPPLDERKRNAVIGNFLTKLGLLNNTSSQVNSSKIFGLFRR